MPHPIRWYVVTQTRKVRVEAHDPLSAAHIAQLAFDDREASPSDGEIGITRATLRVSDLEVREDYY